MNNQEPGRLARFIFRVEFIPYVVFTAIGAAVLYVLGSIAYTALQNGSFIPPPTRLERYECAGSMTTFSIFYLHGTERVQIKSPVGLMDGTVHQNQFDWQGFANDRSLLGFAPPAEILFEDALTLKLSGPDLKDVLCTKAAGASSQRRAIAS